MFSISSKPASAKAAAVLAAIAAVLAASLLCGVQLAWADSVQYIEKSWDADSKQVVSETKTAECTPITSSTTGISGWYVVNGNIDSSKRLVVSGTANIVLADGAKLYLKDGINVPAGTTLNIYAQSEGDSAGELYCDADTDDNAAIGANETKGDCGTIRIHGGKVTADTKTKGEDAAGIGGGEEGNGGTVIIYGGTVKAYGGSANDEGGAGIGGGDCDDGVGGNGGYVAIYGGDVTAVGGANAAGIGGGDDGGNSGLVYIYGGTVNATGGSVNSRGGAGIGGGGTGSGKWIEINGGNVIAKGGANAAGIGGGDEGKSGAIRINGGTVNATGGSDNYDGGAGIGGGNEAAGYDIFIYGGNVTAQGGCDAAGIGGGDGGEGTSIGIDGADTIVNAIGGKYGAGIGGGQGKGSDRIYIRNGSVTAQGGANAAGIGGGESGTGGTITITGGTITATSVSDGAGIGGGDSGTGGTITISGGTVNATGGPYGAGIGGGDDAKGGTINISSGAITATGGEDAAGIGGGESGDGGTIDITGGTITATGGKNGAGIGGGQHGTGGTITINSTTGELITAKSPEDGSGIGGGDLAGGGKITIENGKIKATGGSSHVIVPFDAYDFGGAGIGGGDGGDTGGSGPSGEITINGGDIEAQGGYSAAGIGAGKRSSCETVTITGGKIIAKGGTGTAFSEGRGGAGIGSGSLGSGSGAITISGGDVTATGGANAAGVGGGYEVAGGTINISGGKVSATGGAYKDKGSSSTYDGGAGAGIGGGQGKSGGTITISGGTIEAIGGVSENTKAAGIGGGQDASDPTTITLKYAEDVFDISVKASSYRYSNADTYATVTMENPFKDKDTGDAFEATSYTGSNLDTFENRTLVRANTYGVTVSETQNGSVAADKSRAVPRSTVTLTVTPDEGGWQLKPGTLKVVAGETELALTQNASDLSKYTFTMPEADVTVTAVFMKRVDVESVSLDKETIALVVKDTETLAATVLPEGSDTIVVDKTVTWKSSDTGVAAVDETGKVTAVAPGEATITVTATNGTDDTSDDKTATCTVAVSETRAEVPVPTIASKPYTGVKQTADVPESNLYEVTTNEGGMNVGTYDVVLTLKDTKKYKWAGSEEAEKTLKFVITKATPEVAVPELAVVTYDPGATLAGITLPEGWTWAAPETVPTVGNSGYQASLPVDDANYDYTGVDGYDAATHKVTRTVPLTVNKATNKVSVSLKGWASNEQANEPVVTADYGAADAMIEYKAKDADDEAYSSTKPTQPGEYTVRASIAGSANYLAGRATGDFTIDGPVMVTLTLVGSSIDGNIGEPYVLKVEKGSTVGALADSDDEAAYDALLARFTKGAYAPYNGVFHVISKPLSEYGGWYAVEEEGKTCGEAELNEDTTFYVPLWKAIDSVKLTAQTPTCGADMASVKPAVAVADGSSVKLPAWPPVWWDAASNEEIESGTIEGGKSYRVRVDLDANFGYCFGEGDNAPVVAVTGADEGSASLLPVETIARTEFTVTAEHDLTYSASGSAITAACGICDQAVATLTIVAPTLTTYGGLGDAAATLNGLETFNAATGKSVAAADIRYVGRDGTAYTESATAPTDAGRYTAKITLPGVKTGVGENQSVTASVDYEIAKAEPEPGPAPAAGYAVVSGAGSTWTQGSSSDLAITFKRTDAAEGADSTFSHFRSASVDGKQLAAGTDYTATEGSVVITLKAAYLATLAAGGHTLTAVFDDGEAEAAFTVAKKETPLTIDDKAANGNGNTAKPAAAAAATKAATTAAAGKSATPSTGDPVPVIALAVSAAGAALALVVLRRRRA